MAEMLVGSLILSFLSLATYKILAANLRLQSDSIGGQVQNRQAITALHQIESDLQQIDPGWGTRGVSVIFPAPLLDAAGNPGASGIFDFSNLTDANDSVTFVLPHPEKRQTYKLAANEGWTKPVGFKREPNFATDDAGAGGFAIPIHQPVPVGTPPILVGSPWIGNPPLQEGDFVLVHAPQQWVLLQITEIQKGTDANGDEIVKSFRFRNLDPAVRQEVFAVGGIQAGYVVTREGPPMASFDALGSATGYTQSPTFSAENTIIQPVRLVSYRTRFLHKDGSLASDLTPETEIRKDSQGNRQRFLVRSETSRQTNSTSPAEFDTRNAVLMPVDSFRLAYDVMQTEDRLGNAITDTLQGGTANGAVFRNAGLKYSSSPTDPLDLYYYFNQTAPNSSGSAGAQLPRYLYKIVAVNSQISTVDPLRNYSNKIAVASPLMKLRYQEGYISVTVTGDLQTGQTGSPYFLNYGSDGGDMLIPGTTITRDELGNIIPERTVGEIFVRDQDGRPIVTDSKIIFDSAALGGGDRAFMPTTVIPGPGKNPTRLIIGGIYIRKEGSTYFREPAFAYIDRDPDKMLRSSFEGTPLSCVPANHCRFEPVPTSVGTPHPDGFLDTGGGGAVSPTSGRLYVASTTKEVRNSEMHIYSATPNSVTGRYESFRDEGVVPGTGDNPENQNIHGMLGKIYTHKGRRYLVTCVSNKNDGIEGRNVNILDDPVVYTGRIDLLPLNADGTLAKTGDQVNVTTIAVHNSPLGCNGLDVAGPHIIAGGRLTAQVIRGNVIKNVLETAGAPQKLLLDEVYGIESRNVCNKDRTRCWNVGWLYYADSFQVDYRNIPRTSAKLTQTIQWITGISATEIDELNYDLILANEATIQNTPTPNTLHDASLTRIALTGSPSRVIATIKWNAEINRSEVQAKAVENLQQIDKINLPPGGFQANAGKHVNSSHPWRRLDFPETNDPAAWFGSAVETYVPNGRAAGSNDPLPAVPPAPDTVPPPGCPSPCMYIPGVPGAETFYGGSS